MPSAKCQFCALNTFRENVWTNKQTNKQTNKLENPFIKGRAARSLTHDAYLADNVGGTTI